MADMDFDIDVFETPKKPSDASLPSWQRCLETLSNNAENSIQRWNERDTAVDKEKLNAKFWTWKKYGESVEVKLIGKMGIQFTVKGSKVYSVIVAPENVETFLNGFKAHFDKLLKGGLNAVKNDNWAKEIGLKDVVKASYKAPKGGTKNWNDDEWTWE